MERLNHVWHSNDENLWEAAANEYWNIPTVNAKRALEKRMEMIHQSRNVILSSPTHFYEFLRDDLYPWKLDSMYISTQQRNLSHYHESVPNGLDIIRQRLATNPSTVRQLQIDGLLNQMSVIGGMGISVASGCLAVLFPEHFGTVDRFCLRGFLTVTDDDLTDYFRDNVANPDPFFDDYRDQLRLHVAKLMILLYRRKAETLNANFTTNK
ncbi:MAG TPA: hypothetical protein DD856_01835 [Sulfobacillus sp.]|nr:hypothetical protein [Sulfobacillus sp.]